MSVRTYKQRKRRETSPAVSENNNIKEEIKNNKIKLCLPQLAGKKGVFNCKISWNGEYEEITVEDGLIEVEKNDLEKFTLNGFKEFSPGWDMINRQYYCPEYLGKTFELTLDDETKIHIEKGVAKPVNQYHVAQLKKRHFALYKIED